MDLIRIKNDFNVTTMSPNLQSDEYSAKIAAGSGGFATVLTKINEYPTKPQVEFGYFSNNGEKLFGRIYANSDAEMPTGNIDDITYIGADKFVVVWTNSGNFGTNILYEIISKNGDIIKTASVASASSYPNNPAVTALASGGFAISYAAYANGSTGIYLQQFTSTGQPTGNEINLSGSISGGIWGAPDIDGSSGTIASAWSQQNSSGREPDIKFRSIDIALGNMSTVTTVNTNIIGDQYQSILKVLPNGNYVVVWTDWWGQTGDIYDGS
jgi:hypothetical protein